MTVWELFKDNLAYKKALNIKIIVGNFMYLFANFEEVLKSDVNILDLIVEHTMTIDSYYCVFCIDKNVTKGEQTQTVKDLLIDYKERYSGNKYVEIYQKPIEEIDNCKALVNRYRGNIETSLKSNQNYLNFEVEDYIDEGDRFTVICFANKEQEQRIINAHKNEGK